MTEYPLYDTIGRYDIRSKDSKLKEKSFKCSKFVLPWRLALSPDCIHDPKKHNPEWTQSQIAQSLIDTILHGRRPEWASSRMDTIPNEHHPELTPSRMNTISNGHHREWTLLCLSVSNFVDSSTRLSSTPAY